MKPLVFFGVVLLLVSQLCYAAPLKQAGRWVRVSGIGFEVVEMKNEIAINAETAKKMFTKEFPYLRENWEKAIPGNIENAKDAKNLKDVLAEVKEIWTEARDATPHVEIMGFNEKELVVLVVL